MKLSRNTCFEDHETVSKLCFVVETNVSKLCFVVETVKPTQNSPKQVQPTRSSKLLLRLRNTCFVIVTILVTLFRYRNNVTKLCFVIETLFRYRNSSRNNNQNSIYIPSSLLFRQFTKI